MWVLLVVAVITALGGAAVGAFINDRGARTREALAWDRELERERVRHAREDSAREHEDWQRTFDERRIAYRDMLAAVETALHEYGRQLHISPEIWDPYDHVTASLNQFSVVQIFGSTEVVRLVGECWKHIVMTHVAAAQVSKEPDEAVEDLRREIVALHSAQQEFLMGVRSDLGIARLPTTG
ncbi:hypothetical protein [Pseudonocardia dioxanivorans]|uniref:hypothetical protein n=1 Tax=Pseudonocardia dioxanivorans TaxID=240495 RepID=UPI000CD1CEE8|nr:hypothetical protein [Pseudonocardia dioxanivorans]